MLGKRKTRRPASSKQSRRPWADKFCPRLDELEVRTLMSATASITNMLTINPGWAMDSAGNIIDALPNIPAPLNPAEIRLAYNANRAFLPNGSQVTGAGQTIAIVDWNQEPDISSDINTFSQLFDLPQMNQGAGGPTFKILNENGGTDLSGVPLSPKYPNAAETGIEINLDVDWAHAMAPQANIVLFLASSNSFTDLDTAVTTAAKASTYTQYGLPVAGVISNSYGAPETSITHASSETSNDPVYTTSDNHATFIFSAGDNGRQNYPAESPNVLAIGGTTLSFKTGMLGPTFNTETAWRSGGGGQSKFEAEPSYQESVQTSNFRQDPDVSFNANPSSGVWITDTYDFPGDAAIGSIGGTSLGSPSWAGIFADINQARALNGLGTLGNGEIAMYQDITDYYSGSGAAFRDITVGSNRVDSTKVGWDEVTGFGSPLLPGLMAQLSNVATPAALVGGDAVVGGGLGGTNGMAVVGSTSATPVASTVPGASSLSAATPTLSSPAEVQNLLPSAQVVPSVHPTASNYLFPTATVVAAKMGDTQLDAAQPATQVENATTASSATSKALPAADLSSSAVDAVFADPASANVGGAANLQDHAVALIGEDGGTADLALAAGMAMALSGSWGNVEWEPRRNQVSGH